MLVSQHFYKSTDLRNNSQKILHKTLRPKRQNQSLAKPFFCSTLISQVSLLTKKRRKNIERRNNIGKTLSQQSKTIQLRLKRRRVTKSIITA